MPYQSISSHARNRHNNRNPPPHMMKPNTTDLQWLLPLLAFLISVARATKVSKKCRLNPVVMFKVCADTGLHDIVHVFLLFCPPIVYDLNASEIKIPLWLYLSHLDAVRCVSNTYKGLCVCILDCFIITVIHVHRCCFCLQTEGTANMQHSNVQPCI